MKAAQLMVVILCMNLVGYAQDNKGEKKEGYFVVSSVSNGLNKKSRGALKEILGEEARNVVHTTIQLMGIVGDLQMALSQQEIDKVRTIVSLKTAQDQEKYISCFSSMHLSVGEACKTVAMMQRTFSLMLEALFDNKAPFRRASMPSLRSVIQLVRDTQHKLNAEVRSLKGAIHLIKKNSTLKNVVEDSNAIKQTQQLIDEQREELKKLSASLEKDSLIKQL